MAQGVMMEVVTTTEVAVVEEDMVVVAATVAVEVMVEVEEIEEVDEDMEAEVVAVAEEEAMVAPVMITGVMKEWEEAGEVVETVEAWTTTGVVPSSTIRSPSIKAVCVVATARLILPLLLLHILRNPSHTEFNLKNSTLLSTKHARTTTIVPFTLRT